VKTIQIRLNPRDARQFTNKYRTLQILKGKITHDNNVVSVRYSKKKM